MPVRATKRGKARTPLEGAWDVLVCGASFAGLACARELAGSGARVLVLDRYEIGERQTSACAAPLPWLVNMGLEESVLQRFDSIVASTPRVRRRWRMPFEWATFDYRRLCLLLWDQCRGAEFETALVRGRSGGRVATDRGELEAPLLVDALGWRRVLGCGAVVQPPEARLSRGLEVHPAGRGSDLELIIDPAYVGPGYSWSFPAGDEVRVGVGSFDPRVAVKDPTLRLVADVERSPEGFQGNWIPHRLRRAVEDGVFFCGDSAGHCLPISAEGIRTALFFGLQCGRELRAVIEGRQDVSTALWRYEQLSEERRFAFEMLFWGQRAIPHLHGPVLDSLVRLFGHESAARSFFSTYLRLAPPEAALEPASGVGDGAAGDLAAGDPAEEAVDRAVVAA